MVLSKSLQQSQKGLATLSQVSKVARAMLTTNASLAITMVVLPAIAHVLCKMIDRYFLMKSSNKLV
ncbi:hypothetical protein SDC49_21845 [Lactobacillus sp. R2/2]|nr:hypothetical protein [Lactobacillus sp. R2/2]